MLKATEGRFTLARRFSGQNYGLTNQLLTNPLKNNAGTVTKRSLILVDLQHRKSVLYHDIISPPYKNGQSCIELGFWSKEQKGEIFDKIIEKKHQFTIYKKNLLTQTNIVK